MDGWEKFNEASLPEIKFHSSVTMEYITEGNWKHGKRFSKNFEIKKFCVYDNLYV